MDDGSVDDTAALAGEYADTESGVRLERIPHDGKGAAVQFGMLQACGQYLFMCDADLSMPIDTLPLFLDKMVSGFDIVIGSRQVNGSRRFNESPSRHLRGRIFNWIVRMMTRTGIQDTQCGFKCFKRQTTIQLFEKQTTRGLAFDVEILYAASMLGMSIHELPIDWYHSDHSKVRNFTDTLLMLRDVILVGLRGRHN